MLADKSRSSGTCPVALIMCWILFIKMLMVAFRFIERFSFENVRYNRIFKDAAFRQTLLGSFRKLLLFIIMIKMVAR